MHPGRVQVVARLQSMDDDDHVIGEYATTLNEGDVYQVDDIGLGKRRLTLRFEVVDL